MLSNNKIVRASPTAEYVDMIKHAIDEVFDLLCEEIVGCHAKDFRLNNRMFVDLEEVPPGHAPDCPSVKSQDHVADVVVSDGPLERRGQG